MRKLLERVLGSFPSWAVWENKWRRSSKGNIFFYISNDAFKMSATLNSSVLLITMKRLI